MPLITLPPVQEQATPADVEMAAEEVAMEETEGEDVLGDVQMMFGKDKKYLMEGQ